MSGRPAGLADLRAREYTARRDVTRLRRAIYESADPLRQADELHDALVAAESALAQIAAERARVQKADPDEGLIVDNKVESRLLGAKTTGLEARFELRMRYVPTAIAHLLDPRTDPLVSCTVFNAGNETRRLRVSCSIDGYASRAVDTLELEKKGRGKLRQLPVLRQDAVRSITEMTRAALNVVVEDLDGLRDQRSSVPAVELHQTVPVWLLPRSTALLEVQDPVTGDSRDMTRYLGAFVTPNAPAVIGFLREAVTRHAQRELVGYQRGPDAVEAQVRTVFEALTDVTDPAYVHSVLTSSADDGFLDQRVRLPRESLEHRIANCIDGTVLFASLLEAMSLNAAIVIVPQHALVAWETADGSQQWRHLETTMIGRAGFEEACGAGKWHADRAALTDELTVWPMRTLRGEHRITPME